MQDGLEWQKTIYDISVEIATLIPEFTSFLQANEHYRKLDQAGTAYDLERFLDAPGVEALTADEEPCSMPTFSCYPLDDQDNIDNTIGMQISWNLDRRYADCVSLFTSQEAGMRPLNFLLLKRKPSTAYDLESTLGMPERWGSVDVGKDGHQIVFTLEQKAEFRIIDIAVNYGLIGTFRNGMRHWVYCNDPSLDQIVPRQKSPEELRAALAAAPLSRYRS